MANNITINGLVESNWEGLILFSDIPNIVTYTNSDQGDEAYLMINVGTTGYTAQPSGHCITINGETITSVTDISKVGGRYFYLGANNAWVAPTIVDALRNCPNIAANYEIMMYSGDDGDIVSPYSVMVKAKTTGTKFNITYSTTMVDTHTLSFTNHQGQSNDSLKNDTFAKIQLQIYKYTDFDRYEDVDAYGDVLNDEEYVVTLIKTYYSDEVKFDISPVLSTFAEYGRLVYFRMVMTLFTSSNEHPFSQIASVHHLYTTIGYRCNGSQPYIVKTNTPLLMQNVGNGIDWANLHTLYVYKPSISFSWVSTAETSTFQIKYLDSAYNQKYSAVSSLTNNYGIDNVVSLNEDYMEECSYVSIQLPNNKGNVLYTIIKGVNAADECTRIYFRNCYGGISFFDFTGQHSKTLDLETESYEKGDLDYYSDVEREQEIIYSRDVKHNYTVNSHLIDKQGTQIFEDMAKSKKCWIKNDETNEIENVIIDDIQINESSDYNDIYTVTVTYHLSREN